MDKNNMVFKCGSCGRISESVSMNGCLKCRKSVFISIFKDDMRKEALRIIHG